MLLLANANFMNLRLITLRIHVLTANFFLSSSTLLNYQTEDEASDDDGMIEYVEDLDEEDEEDMEDMEMNAWDDDESEEESDDDDDESSEEEDVSESGSDDDESGSGSDEEDSDDDDQVKKKKKKPSAKPSKKQQPKKPKRGVRVEIEYEDENDAMMEEEGVSAGAGLAW